MSQLAGENRLSRVNQWKRAPRPLITPSLLACDFARMDSVLAGVAELQIPGAHLDVMDGHFVPNLSYGAPVISRWRAASSLFFDAHLMISDPARYVDDFIEAGCDQVIFHLEVVPDPRQLLAHIRAAGCLAGLSLNPPTPVDGLLSLVDELDCVLVMSVMPGFGGQSFQPEVLDKIRRLRQAHPDLDIAIDGGLNPQTIGQAVAAGATQIVAGSAFFTSPEGPREAYKSLLTAARDASATDHQPSP